MRDGEIRLRSLTGLYKRGSSFKSKLLLSFKFVELHQFAELWRLCVNVR